MDTTRRMSMAFPVIGQIRKGSPKVQKTRSDGSKYETVGADLASKFRVIFFPGHNGADLEFMKEYGTITPERIRAMLPFGAIEQSWQYYHEAYTAGRMVAQADDVHYLTRRNAVSGEYAVRNGEPYTKFCPGETISYENNGKSYELPIKPTGRLRLWLPCFERMVMMELRTTSYYDCQNISNQLAAIEAIGQTLNRGSVAGIPMWIYRRPAQISYTKPDGSASRVEKWLINIEADSAWVKNVFARMRASAFGLPGGAPILPALAEPVVVEGGGIDPETDEDESSIDPAEIPDAVYQAKLIVLGARKMGDLTNDELMLLGEKGSKAAKGIQEAAGKILDWRIQHGDNGYDGGAG